MNSTIPSLVLLNSRQVSQSVLSPVSLGVSAFTVQCDDGLKSFSHFNFLWTVFRDGLEDKSLKSLSKNPSKFVLSPKTLQFGSTYRISILVTHQGTLLSNSDEYFVTLVSSPLVVAIGGPTRRALKLGEVITVDGTKSYDPDGVSSTLKMTWQCFRVKPSFSQICDLALYHRSPGLIDISATNASVVGFQFNLSLAVSDTTRRSFSSILIDVAPPEAPTISISLPSSDVPPSRWNPNRDLVVSGTILTSVPGRAYWRVENAGVSLKNLNGTRSSKPIRPGLNSFNLLLKGGSLPPSDHFPYVLSLQATDQSSVASVQIFMNSPPRSGQFSVTPDIGISMVTQFAFFASQWIDSDLPLSYEFSYCSGGISLPLQSRSELSSTSSFLPVGTQRDGGSVVCSVTVFDILGSRTNASHSVKVTTDSVVVGTVAETVTSKLLEAQGNLELTRQLISVSSSLMSVRNCTGAPNCASLNRDECLKTDHMCGACLPNYLGAPGDGNSLCLSITENEEPFSTCSDDSNCFSWQFCSKDSCSPRSRHCDDDCSHHGDCQFQTIDSGETIPFCAVTDLTCEATCECDQGWNGPTCAITDSEIQSRSLLRDVLLAQLRELTEVDEPSLENIDSWTSSLSSLSIARDELSSLGIFLVSNISEIILASSPSVSTLVNLCESLDGVTRGQKNGRRLLSEHSSVNSLLTRTGLMLAQSLIPEAQDYEVIQSSFRLSTPLLSSSQPQATALQTPLEVRSHMPTSFCTIAGLGDDEESRLTFLSLKSKYFSGPSTSNPLSLQMAAANLPHFPSFLCVLYHHRPQNFTEVMSPEYLNVTCPSGEERIFEKDCFGGNLGNVTISLTCNGTAATLSKRCPTLKTEGVCVSFGDDSPFQCTTVRYDSISTTCSCNQSSLGNRRLSNSEASLLQLYSLNKEIFVDFKATILTSDQLNADSLSKSAIILLMFGWLWGLGIFGLLVCFMNRQYRRGKLKEFQNNKIKAVTRGRTENVSMNGLLAKYIDEVFPVVFQSRSYFARMVEEIFKHHRYISLLSSPKDNDLRRSKVVTCFHLLSVQTMLMFLLAVCYELQFPSDDGTCGKQETEKSCVDKPSVLDSKQQLCHWTQLQNGDFACKYSQQTVTWQTTIVISILVTLFSSLGTLLLDYLFIDILSAPTAESDDDSPVPVSLSPSLSPSPSQVRVRVTRAKSTLKLDNEVRVVPRGLVTAHSEAALSFGQIMSGSEDRLKTEVTHRNSIRMKRLTEIKSANPDLKNSLPSQSIKEVAPAPSQFPLQPSGDLLLQSLFDDLEEERRKLKRESEKESFDSLWGIQSSSSDDVSRRVSDEQKEIMKRELVYVLDETSKKVEKLRSATDIQIGMEILHLFILDLLGRDTPAAKIFRMKSEEDFRHSMVVTNLFKGLTWVGVVLLNLGMIYFTMLRGLQRGYHWQRVYLFACLLQFVVEIIFYETSECLLMNFWIPDLVRTEVLSVGFSIRQILQKLCSGSLVTNTQLSLDTPNYFFISTNIASHFPNSMASLIVLSYHSWSPGELSQKWKSTHQTFATKLFYWISPTSRTRSRVRRYTLTAVIVTLLQQLGSISPTLQRLILHVAQPVVFGGIFLLGYLMIDYPLSFIGAGVALLATIYLIYRAMAEDRSERNEEGDANPVIFPKPFVPAEVPSQESFREELKMKEGSGDAVAVPQIQSQDDSSPLRIRDRARSYSSELRQEDRDSFDQESNSNESPHRSRLSSSSEEFHFRRVRGESIESTDSSLPERAGGNSFEWNGREMIWSESPPVTEEFHAAVDGVSLSEHDVNDHSSSSPSVDIQIRRQERVPRSNQIAS